MGCVDRNETSSYHGPRSSNKQRLTPVLRRYKEVLESGKKLLFKTTDPDQYPLPSFELLAIRWILYPIAAPGGVAADADDDSDYDSDSDDGDWLEIPEPNPPASKLFGRHLISSRFPVMIRSPADVERKSDSPLSHHLEWRRRALACGSRARQKRAHRRSRVDHAMCLYIRVDDREHDRLPDCGVYHYNMLYLLAMDSFAVTVRSAHWWPPRSLLALPKSFDSSIQEASSKFELSLRSSDVMITNITQVRASGAPA